MPFLSTPSARRATYHTHHFWIILLYFYPRPPRGGRHALPSLYSTALKFLSTPSARRATFCDGFAQRRSRISIHALREEGDLRPLECSWVPPISIHALREEGDFFFYLEEKTCLNFYPRPPRGGRRPVSYRGRGQTANFYPRPPRGGRPGPRRSRPGKSSNFYPRPPRGGRHIIPIIFG